MRFGRCDQGDTGVSWIPTWNAQLPRMEWEEIAMCRGINCVVLILSLLLTVQPTSSRAAEDWADPNLKVTKGLEIWLDASRQNPARQRAKLPELPSGMRVGVWYDASGKRRHLSQKVEASQPAFQS